MVSRPRGWRSEESQGQEQAAGVSQLAETCLRVSGQDGTRKGHRKSDTARTSSGYFPYSVFKKQER